MQVNDEIEQRARIEKNVIVSGLKEMCGVDEESARATDAQLVEKLVGVLGIDPKTVSRRARLRKRGVMPDPARPSQLLIEFVDSKSAAAAIVNSKKLASVPDFKRVYINKDLTEAARRRLAWLRADCKTRNQALPREENGLRYDVDDENRRWFWGIRDMDVKKIYREKKNRTD